MVFPAYSEHSNPANSSSVLPIEKTVHDYGDFRYLLAQNRELLLTPAPSSWRTVTTLEFGFRSEKVWAKREVTEVMLDNLHAAILTTSRNVVMSSYNVVGSPSGPQYSPADPL